MLNNPTSAVNSCNIDWAQTIRVLLSGPHPGRKSCIWGTVRNDRPPLVRTAVTGRSIRQQHVWMETPRRPDSICSHRHTEIRVSVEDVHLHLPHAASCTPSLSLPDSSRRRAADLQPLLSSPASSTSPCKVQIYVVMSITLEKNTV